MKAVILAGGLGSRISEETDLKPKPMIEIGGRPILWHIMKIYSAYGINDFIICCGYKSHIIKEYFANYFLYMSDVTFNMIDNSMTVHRMNAEPWQVTLIDTGENTMTGGRLKRISNHLGDEQSFCFTYGDGVSDINIQKLIKFHKLHGKLATLTAIKPTGRFGSLTRKGSLVTGFKEKPAGDGAWVNGGFFVLNKKVIDLIDGDQTIWEADPLEKISKMGQLEAFEHNGFWHSIDTLRDKNYLNRLWLDNNSPWKCWD
jgi:glucose-1-phosphate cytidylyltransferase